MEAITDKLLNRRAVAKMLDVSWQTVKRWSAEGRIPKPLRGWPGREPRWSEAEILAEIRKWRDADLKERTT